MAFQRQTEADEGPQAAEEVHSEAAKPERIKDMDLAAAEAAGKKPSVQNMPNHA